MKSPNFARNYALLRILCCMVALAALGAVLFLDAPVWPTSLAALFIVILLARRLFALLATPKSDEPPSLSKFSDQEGLLRHDHHQR